VNGLLVISTLEGVVQFLKKLLLIIFSPPCQIKVFDENIPGFFSIKCTLKGTKRSKRQFQCKLKTVLRALNDSR